MPEYIEFPIETDPNVLLNEVIEEVRANYPNWNPREGSLAFRAMAALCRMIAERADVAAAPQPSLIFRTLGESLHNLPPFGAFPARAETTWTAEDNAGYGPIPVGTILSIGDVLFETEDEVTFPSGTTVVGPIGIVAIDDGAAGNDLGAAAEPIDLEEQYPFVASVTLNSATSGGADAEAVDDYMARLRAELQLLTRVPILGRDLAIRAKTHVGVERALVLDNYDAPTATHNVEGVATVVPIDSEGNNVPQATKDDLVEDLTSSGKRLLNGVIYVIDPTRTTVAVNVEAIGYPGIDVAAAEATAEEAVALLLDPANHGQPPSGERREWINKTVISQFDVASAVDHTEAIDRVTMVEISLNGDAFQEADRNLPGVAPLPTVGAINVTVTLP